MSQHPSENQILDGYRLVRFLGRGGFGEVWLCRSEAMGDYRALKWIPATHADRMQKEYESLLHFRNAAARLRSPHLVPIEHVNRNEAGLFYVMPLADGMAGNDPSDPEWQPQSLAAKVHAQANQPQWFTSREILDLIHPVLQALQTLSDAGLVHRDVKPDNILFFHGLPCLGDISLLGADASLITRRGTPGYATPSWYVGGHPDMYGAAATLYTLLTGNLPDKMGRSAFLWPPRGQTSLSESERLEWRHLHGVSRRATEEKVAERFVDFAAMAAAIADASPPARAGRTSSPLPTASARKMRGLLPWLGAAALLAVILRITANHPPPPSTVTAESPSPPPSRRTPKIVDAGGNFTSVRERVISAIPAAISVNSPDNQLSLDLTDYAKKAAILEAYENREYPECLSLLDARMESYPDLKRKPLCLRLKALLLKQLRREDEIDGLLSAISSSDSTSEAPDETRHHLALLEALERYDDAEKFVTGVLQVNLAPPRTSKGSVSDTLKLVELYNQRARVRILSGDHAGALADEHAALKLPPGSYPPQVRGMTTDKIQQAHLNTVVMQWELLEQELPAYAEYLDSKGWPEPKPDHRNLDAMD